MVDVASIAKAAFDGVSAAITDAVADATLSDGLLDYQGRVVFGGDKAPSGFPMPTAKDKVRPAYLEGFAEIAGMGWTLTSGGVEYYVLSTRDIVEAGGFQVVNLIKASDLLWTSADFTRTSRTPDGAGGYTTGTITIASDISVGLVAMSGQERWQSQRVEALSDWRLWCRPVDGLTEADSVTIDGRTYAIRFVNDIEQRGVWQVIDLKLGAAS